MCLNIKTKKQRLRTAFFYYRVSGFVQQLLYGFRVF
jgi:hypothetical protein